MELVLHLLVRRSVSKLCREVTSKGAGGGKGLQEGGGQGDEGESRGGQVEGGYLGGSSQ